MNAKMGNEVEAFFRSRWGIDKDKVYRLLLEFNRSLNDDDEVGGYTAVCDSVVEGYNVTDESLHKCFCKGLIRNLVKVTNGSETYTYKDTMLEVQTMKSNAPCDILNLWLLLYILKYGVQGNDILYVFTAISNLSEVFNPMEHENCKYTGTFTAELKKDGSSIFKDIYKWFLNEGSRNIGGAMDNSTACNEKSKKDDQKSESPKWELGKIRPEMKDKVQEVLEVIEELRTTVKKIEDELAPPKTKPEDNDCKDKGTLCDRVKCVTERWKSDSKKEDYTGMWKEVEAMVDELAKVIPKENGEVDKYCSVAIWNGKTTTFAEMEACRLIVRGLDHIYKIKTAGGGHDEKAKNDQIFHRTMACLLLNAYAKKMEEKAKENGCDVKNGIEHAFGESSKIQGSACSDGTCDICQQESYKDCFIDKDKVEDKVRTISNKENPGRNM
ncbi:SICA antigen [Plasmodium coatneyi]|uniref:SICA antigen n=1 Tax=Plasmodium coatneyi TaxID=208452 RepID=A0A1B1DXG3_9APIC|nr:SICA antigen [Plasmodium coatneyi]ANQ07430.1 SICA antigen [Plasmodium coatneyi]